MSAATVTKELEHAYEAALNVDTAAAEAERARKDYVQALAVLHSKANMLRRIGRSLGDSLTDDAMGATIRAILAIHRGDDEEAYQFARASARAMAAVRASEALFVTGSV